MPELPEVETVKNKLSFIKGQRIKAVQVSGKKLRFPVPRGFIKKISGQRVTGLYRRAKYLLIALEKGTLVSHLGMTGNWRRGGEELQKHDHVILQLDDFRVIYSDPRRFGFIDYFQGSELPSYLSKLGPEPLDDEFAGEWLYQKARLRKGSIKSVIMDQAVVVGVGNIYASESLFLAGIRPGRGAYRVTRHQCDELVCMIRKVLQHAIEKGGSTIRDFQSPEGDDGYFQMEFKVYGRDGESCLQCGDKIKKAVHSQRSSFYCPSCQK